MKRIFRALPILICAAMLMCMASSCGKDDNNSSDDSNKSSSSVYEVTAIDQITDEDDSDTNSGSEDTPEDKNNSGNSAESGSGQQGSQGQSGSVGNNGGAGNNADGNTNSASDNKSDSDKNNTGNNGGNTSDKNSSPSSNKGNGSASGNSDGNSNNNTSGNNQSSGGNKTNVKLTGKEKTFVITIYPDIAPKTCSNFLGLVNDGFYNGLKFTRVIDNFLAQAGATKSDGTGGSGVKIKGEFSNNGVKNSLSHLAGVVSMYRDPGDPNSADSQFFICYNDNCKFMDGNYAAFGKVTQGFNVVQDFQNVERETGYDGNESKPVTPITIVLAQYTGKDSSGNPQIKFYVTY